MYSIVQSSASVFVYYIVKAAFALVFWVFMVFFNCYCRHQPWLGSVMQVSVDGLLCCTISNDKSVKIYDVVNYDMMLMIRLPFIPGAAEWVYKQGDVKARLAISDRNSSFVHIYDARADSNEPIISKEVSWPLWKLHTFESSSRFLCSIFLIHRLIHCPVSLSYNLINVSSILTLHFPDTLGASKSYEVQPCFWHCDICWWQGHHRVLEPWYPAVPWKRVCASGHAK